MAGCGNLTCLLPSKKCNGNQTLVIPPETRLIKRIPHNLDWCGLSVALLNSLGHFYQTLISFPFSTTLIPFLCSAGCNIEEIKVVTRRSTMTVVSACQIESPMVTAQGSVLTSFLQYV